MRKFINTLSLLFSSIPKPIISKVSSISNPLAIRYLINYSKYVEHGSTSKTNVHSLHYVVNRNHISQHESYYV